MITEFLTSNMQFILGFLATIIVWLIARIFKGASVDKTQIIALLSLVLEIIPGYQDQSRNCRALQS